ncbi:MAG: response regulator transcription factor, partial [Chloroflexota bacterium]|nr:response regulator transcription factor [Chloroflexota bacterium]
FNHDRETQRPNANAIRVVLADDHQLFRQGLKALLELERGITVAGEASDGHEVQRVSLEQHADVVLMDINMPIVDGLSATRELLRADAKIGVIILSMHHEEGHVFQALRAGARGYLLKTSRVSEVAGAVRAVASGLSLLDPSVTSSVVSEFKRMSSKQTPEDGLGQLTETEVKILQHVSAGMSNKEIASKLSLAESTVKNRLSVLFEKIGVFDRTQAAIYAITHGIAPTAVQSSR